MPRTNSKRDTVLARIKVAGYHDDGAAFTRLYINNRIGWDAAREAFERGKRAKASGVACTCPECQNIESNGDQP